MSATSNGEPAHPEQWSAGYEAGFKDGEKAGAALRADAERYRWLRSTTNHVTNNAGERIDVRNKPWLWDAAIDAERKEKP